MSLKNHLHEAFSNLFSAKLRSFLAILGILVGTGSVVAMVSCGQLATKQALKQFERLGTDLLSLSVFAGNTADNASTNSKQLTLNDVYNIKEADPDINYIAPYTNAYSVISYEGKKINGTIIGATEDLQKVIKIDMQAGRFISFLDKNDLYGVIGSEIAKTLKAQGVYQPIGKQLYLGTNIITIIGVAKEWPENAFFNQNINRGVIIPIETSMALSKYTKINSIVMSINPISNIDSLQKKLENQIKNLMPNSQLFIRSAKQIIESMTHQKKILTLLLGLIGSISLFVGGIGVMNIMLVSVVERKREIGLRKAVGARRSDIQLLFLIESITLSLFGGLLGVIFGIGASYIIASFSKWDFVIFLLPPIIGFSVSVAIGVFFGFYPAYKASRLDPIQCLRSE